MLFKSSVDFEFRQLNIECICSVNCCWLNNIIKTLKITEICAIKSWSIFIRAYLYTGFTLYTGIVTHESAYDMSRRIKFNWKKQTIIIKFAVPWDVRHFSFAHIMVSEFSFHSPSMGLYVNNDNGMSTGPTGVPWHGLKFREYRIYRRKMLFDDNIDTRGVRDRSMKFIARANYFGVESV